MANSVPITVIGNLTGDPELRFSPAGKAVARFTVAHNPRQLDKASGEWKDGSPSFFTCTAFGDLAEHLADSLHKGDRVLVAGAWEQQHYEKDGEKKSSWQLLVDEVGPSLRYHIAQVTKAARSRYDDGPPDDDWASASRTRPAEPAAAGGF